MPTRALVGMLLALIAVLMIWSGAYVFAAFVTVAAVAAAREWYRMVAPAGFTLEWVICCTAIVAAVAMACAVLPVFWPLVVLAAGTLSATAVSAGKKMAPFWSGLGVLYIGVPAWSLVAIRERGEGAGWLVLGILIVIWTADTGALVVGRIVGGPKLLPSLSPNKTWSGLAGGLALPSLVAAGYSSVFGGNAVAAFALGLLLAGTAHAGDLFESWVKRRVGRKDSGESIPGHGGVLDRLDSTLFVVPLAAVLEFTFGIRALLGVHA